jgi:hypothetical protein
MRLRDQDMKLSSRKSLTVLPIKEEGRGLGNEERLTGIGIAVAGLFEVAGCEY